VVESSDFPAPAVVGIEIGQLGAQKQRLQLIEATIETAHVVMVFLLRAVVSQHADTLGEKGVVRGDSAGITKRAALLAGIEAERSRMPDAADRPALVARAVSLRRILQYLQSAVLGQREDGIHVRGVTVEMYGYDRAR